MMSAGRKVSVSLGILLLIGSVIGILVILGRSGLESSRSGAGSKTLNLERHRYHHKHGLQPHQELQPGGDGYRTYRPGRINGVASPPANSRTTTPTTTTTTLATPAEPNEAEVNGNEQRHKKKVLQRLEERVNSKRNEKVINEMEKGRIDGGGARGAEMDLLKHGEDKPPQRRRGQDLETRPGHPVGVGEEAAAPSVNVFRNTQDSFGGESVKNVHETYSQMNWNKFMPSSPAPPPPASHRKPLQVSSTKDKWPTHPATPDDITSSTGLQHDFDNVYNSASGDLMVGGGSDHQHEMYAEDMLDDEDGYEEEDQEDEEYLMDEDGEGLDEDQVEERWALPSSTTQSSLHALAQKTLDLNKLFEMAKEIYNLGNNQSNLNELWRVVNETVRKSSNESNILSHLNVVYKEPSGMSIKVDGLQGLNSLGGRNKVEKSLSAFAFMSFGIFLLNQIHKLMGKEGGSFSGREGRGMGSESPMAESSLDILFQPPDALLNDTSSESSSTKPEYHNVTNIDEAAQGRKLHSPPDDAGGSSNWVEASIHSSGSMNDMFRGALNLMNAYTKDGKVLECIWSLYCHDLDNTAAQQGLYGLAARINSIGLRLIMEQIPAELTLDVLLRSLLGWDGLPCKRMFPKCLPEDAVKALKASSVQRPLGSSQNLSS